jgi:hypothetical protein
MLDAFNGYIGGVVTGPIWHPVRPPDGTYYAVRITCLPTR